MDKAMSRPLWTLLSTHERERVKRRVFIDVGARKFASSSRKFLSVYPDARNFDEVVGIEMDPSYARGWEREAASWAARTASLHGRAPHFEMMNAAFASYNGSVRMPVSGVAATMLHLPVGGSSSIGARDAPLRGAQMVDVPVYNMSRWLLSRFSPADFVVLKLDVEGTEYELLPLLLGTGALAVVDELFIEMHFDRQSWKSTDRRTKCSEAAEAALTARGLPCVHRHEALHWLQFMREMCVYVHEWG